MAICVSAGCIFYLINPNDAQYKSYYYEEEARKALAAGDIEKYFINIDRPEIIKYHFASNHILVQEYIDAGKYDDALRVINAYEKDLDYYQCTPYKPLKRLGCRILITVNNVSISYNKNHLISQVYFEKGDYKKALDYELKSEKKDPCYLSRIYSALYDFKNAESLLTECKQRSTTKKYIKRSLHFSNGYFLFKQKKYKEAIVEFEKDINTLKCGNVCRSKNRTYLYLAECYKNLGNKTKAKEYYNWILESENYFFKAKTGLSEL